MTLVQIGMHQGQYRSFGMRTLDLQARGAALQMTPRHSERSWCSHSRSRQQMNMQQAHSSQRPSERCVTFALGSLSVMFAAHNAD